MPKARLANRRISRAGRCSNVLGAIADTQAEIALLRPRPPRLGLTQAQIRKLRSLAHLLRDLLLKLDRCLKTGRDIPPMDR